MLEHLSIDSMRPQTSERNDSAQKNQNKESETKTITKQ